MSSGTAKADTPLFGDDLFGDTLFGDTKPTQPLTIDSIPLAERLRPSCLAEVVGQARRVGEMVMRELKKLDEVAYIRFASVYKSFQGVDDFTDAIEEVRRPGRAK